MITYITDITNTTKFRSEIVSDAAKWGANCDLWCEVWLQQSLLLGNVELAQSPAVLNVDMIRLRNVSRIF